MISPTLFKALRHLSQDEFRSGSAIAQVLGISRSTLSNILAEADQVGVELYRIQGRGYRLVEPLDWLRMDEVIKTLDISAKRFDLAIVDTTESTNADLMARAALGAPSGTALVAEFQSGGRGRRGRRWFSPLCGGLTFSLLWRFNQGAARLSSLSLAVGVAVARALREIGVADAQLKWPNDIVHHFRKLGGILIELSGDVLGPTAVVIGVGINVRLNEPTLTQIDQAAIDLMRVLENVPSRSVVLGNLMRHLSDVLQQFDRDGFAPFRDEWLAAHAYHDRAVRLFLPRNRVEEGVVSGIGDDGSLLVQGADGVKPYTVGEISLKAAA